MPTTATLTSKGQITLPKSVRNHFGLKEGDLIVFESTPQGAFLVKPTGRKSRLEGLLRKYLPKNFRPPTVEDMNHAISKKIREAFRKK